MKSTAWKEVKRVLALALELPEEELEKFLAETCQDEAVRREVASLLAAGEEGVGFLEEPMFQFDEGPSRLGEEIGGYRLVRLLGRGGMGTVYLARRMKEEGEGPEEAAIKVLGKGFDREEVRRRFRNEGQILANLEHPNIAHLLDIDTTADGSPCLVMEYIEGEPIHHYCNSRDLSVAERLKLFREVCSAVQYAHQCLVIHRDLKPGNILVTAEGTPKLLDFGIAKLLDSESFAPITETAEGLRFMTPEYASPEQVQGEVMTTASDLYSLGVLLYELLTGQRPYRLKHGLREEVARVVCHETPEKPSLIVARTSEGLTEAREQQGRLRRQLAGDLDTIVLMTLRKEAARRYSSVEQLSEDIERHLQGLPVRARGDGVFYRTGKFLRRHRLSLAFASTLLIVILFFYTALVQQQQRTALERDRSQQLVSFLTEMFRTSSLQPVLENQVTTREILDRGRAQALEHLGHDPKTQAEVLNTLARTYAHLGDEAEAAALARRASLLVDDEAFAERQELKSHLRRSADAILVFGEFLKDRGDAEVAEPLVEEFLRISRHFLPEDDPVICKTEQLLVKLGEQGGGKE